MRTRLRTSTDKEKRKGGTTNQKSDKSANLPEMGSKSGDVGPTSGDVGPMSGDVGPTSVRQRKRVDPTSDR